MTIIHTRTHYMYIMTMIYIIIMTINIYPFRAVAPSPAGPAMAGPVFAAGTKILNNEDMYSKHAFKLGKGYWPKVKQRSKSKVVLLQCCRT